MEGKSGCSSHVIPALKVLLRWSSLWVLCEFLLTAINGCHIGLHCSIVDLADALTAQTDRKYSFFFSNAPEKYEIVIIS